jgi:hypothetical protein
MGQFHQHFTRSFYTRKLRAQLFCAYVLGLYFIGPKAARRTLVKLTPFEISLIKFQISDEKLFFSFFSNLFFQ